MKRTLGYFIFFILVLCLLAAVSQAFTIVDTGLNITAAGVNATGFKRLVYDHGTKSADYTIDLSAAEMHVVAFTAAANLTISSSLSNDKAMVVVKSGGAWNINLKGVDNGATNLTAAANAQDLLGFTKAFGKITLGASALNYPTN